ncbi:MAG: hypothetical protein HY850_05535 [Betaproteobacteria bacterium]|nr:hypothetical protein [Betaproteobacteria bacterium]
MLVSAELPLRANLSVLENIALVPQYRHNAKAHVANERAWALLERLGYTACAHLRDPDLDFEQRFVAKLLRAVIAKPSIIVIERPGLLLPDTPYPRFLAEVLSQLDKDIDTFRIVDYAWHAPLYPPI